MSLLLNDAGRKRFIQKTHKALLWLTPSQCFQKREKSSLLGHLYGFPPTAVTWLPKICPYFFAFAIRSDPLTRADGCLLKIFTCDGNMTN